MDNDKQSIAFVSSFIGFWLGIMLMRPKNVAQATFAFLAGFFTIIAVVPALSDILTWVSVHVSWLGWLNAAPGTGIYLLLAGICPMLSLQIVLYIYHNGVRIPTQFLEKRLRENDREDRK